MKTKKTALTMQIGNKTMGRIGCVCTLCHTSLTAKQVYQITPPQGTAYSGFCKQITVCSKCKENNN